MSSGRDRRDFDFGAVFRGRQRGLLIDAGSEVSDPVEFVEPSHPELNADEGLNKTVQLPEATRVVIVGNSDPQYARSSWHGYSRNVFFQAPQMIVAANEHRVSVTLRNLDSADALHVGGKAEEASADGFVIPAGTAHTFYHQVEIWATLKTGTATDFVNVAIACEYSWKID